MALKVVGLGAGGHARVCIDILRQDSRYELIGLLDPDSTLYGKTQLGIPVLGDDSKLPVLVGQGVGHFFVGVGSTSSLALRKRLYEWGLSFEIKPVAVIHPNAIISSTAKIGPGLMAMAGAIVNTQAQIGQNVIINTSAVVEHDCVISDHVHIATGARLAGGVSVGKETHIGIGAVVRQSITIGRQAVVGAGAVVIRDVGDGEVVVGNPAKRMEVSANDS